MSMHFVIHQQGQWLSFEHGQVIRSSVRPKLSHATTVITDFEGAVSNVISLEGSPAHAVALIERRMRSDGLIDTDSKILIHKTRSIGAGYQTLFTAVPLDLWQQIYAWAEAQPDHCLLVPATSLLFKALKTGQGMVLQAGRQVSVLALHGHDMIYRTALAYSDDPADLAMTVSGLAEQFADDLSKSDDNTLPLEMHWCPVLVPRPAEGEAWADDNLRAIFSANCGIEVKTVHLRRVLDEAGNEYRSGIGFIESIAGPGIAINPATSRIAYLAESALPFASAASLAFALVLGTLGARWALSAAEANTRAETLREEITQTEARIEALAAQEAVPEGFEPTLAFIERARRLQSGADPAATLVQVRNAAAGQVRVLRVKLEEPEAPAAGPRGQSARNAKAAPKPVEGYTLRVDGVVDQGRGTPGMQIATFVQNLRDAGFEPRAIDPQGGGGGTNKTASGFFSYLITSPALQATADKS